MKVNVIGSFEEAVEQGGQALKQNAKAFTKAAVGQIAGSQGTNEQVAKNNQQMSDDQAKKFLKDLYGKTDKKQEGEETGSRSTKTPEELAKLENLRKQLHQNYYQSLIKPSENQEKERPAEKVEREDKQKEWELVQKEKKKPSPLPATVKQGTGEKMVGIAG